MTFTNQTSKEIWQDRYQKNNETLRENIERVARHCATNEEDYMAFEQLMGDGLFFPAGRTMSNAGIGRTLTLNNCYVSPMIKDDMTDIFNKVKLGALTHKAGGGIGYSFSQLRPNGTPTSNDAIASGAISFMDVFNAQTATIMQGSRRGANMAVMSVYSMDIEEFITAKSKDPSRLQHFNISVMVDDDFMKAKDNNQDIWLHYPVYDEDGNILKNQSEWTYKKSVNAKSLWDLIIKEAYNTGEPGIFFQDTMNKDNNLWYIENIVATNPCVTGDTLVLTDSGYKRIDSLIGQSVLIWNGYEFSEVVPKITGHNQDMAKINFSDGTSLTCTLYHKFILQNDTRVSAKELKIGDKLTKFDFPIIEGTETLGEKDAYTKGFFCGDGTIANPKTNRNIIALYSDKRDLLPFLDYTRLFKQGEGQDNRTVIVLPDGVYDKDFVPNNSYTISSRLHWLAGLIDSDGCLNSSDGSISISSNNRDFLMSVKLMLNTLGCAATVSLMKPKGLEVFPDSDGKSTHYYRQNCYRLTINATNVKKMMDLGLKTHRVELVANPNRDASRFIQVIGVELLDVKADAVYCFNEVKNHSAIFNGVMTAQCAEYLAGTVYGNHPTTGQRLNPDEYGGACNLGSLFLHNFVDKPFTNSAQTDYGKLENAIYSAVRMLDNIIDINHYPDEIYKNYQHSFRVIGLGVTGLADMLCMLGLRYSSQQAQLFVWDLMNFIALHAYRASIELAKEKGSFPFLDKEKFVQSGYLQKHAQISDEWKQVIEDIKQHGIRNAKILSIAPTGTLSLTFGNNCSSGIEPIFSLEYDRKVKIGGQDEDNTQIIKVRDYAYDLWLNTTNKTVGKDVFVTAMEMSVEDHIDMLKNIAFHVDMGISKTINIPTEYSFEKTKEVYDKCYTAGIKGATIFRPNPIRQGILIADDNSKNKGKTISKECNAPKLERGVILNVTDDVIGKKRKLTTGCGTLHCIALFDPINGDLLETYLSKGSSGGCNNFMTGLSRMISLSARGGLDIYSIIDQLRSSGTCPSYSVRKATKGDVSKGSSCPVAVSYALLDMHKEVLNDLGIDDEYVLNNKEVKQVDHVAKKINTSVDNTKERCPECKEEIISISGCVQCVSCGWSQCN